MLNESDRRATHFCELMSSREVDDAAMAETNAAVAAAATAAAAEAAAASKAAAAPEAATKAAAAANKRKAIDVRTPKKKPDLRKEPGGGAGPVDGEDSFERAAVFGVGELVRVLPATAPGYLPRLAEGCGKGHVTAFDPISASTRSNPWPCIRGSRPKSRGLRGGHTPRRHEGIVQSRRST